MSNIFYGENLVPDAAQPMPVTSYQQQYARMSRTDDAPPLQPAYSDIAAEVAFLEANANASGGGNKVVFDIDRVER